MYCKKCGKPNENNAVFCKSCGARLVKAATYQPKPNARTSTKRAKKKFPVKIVAAVLAVIAIAATVFAVSPVLTAGKNDRKNYEDTPQKSDVATPNNDAISDSNAIPDGDSQKIWTYTHMH